MLPFRFAPCEVCTARDKVAHSVVPWGLYRETWLAGSRKASHNTDVHWGCNCVRAAAGRVFRTNAVGPLLITKELVLARLLGRGSVLANMTSKVSPGPHPTWQSLSYPGGAIPVLGRWPAPAVTQLRARQSDFHGKHEPCMTSKA